MLNPDAYIDHLENRAKAAEEKLAAMTAERDKFELALRFAVVEIRESYEGSTLCPNKECGWVCDDETKCIEMTENRLLKQAEQANDADTPYKGNDGKPYFAGENGVADNV